jgi:hypothetical protein
MNDPVKVDWRDDDGIWRRSLVPDASVNPAEGIPLELPLNEMYGHMPPSFRVRLSEALHAYGIVEPADYLKPGAPELIRNAILDAAAADALSLVSFAKRLSE